MSSIFHDGERAVQMRAGVGAMAARVGNGIHAEIPPAAAEFLADQFFVVAGSEDAQGRVWTSLLYGAPGFMRVVSDTQLAIDALPFPTDPLYDTLKIGRREGVPLGLLAIEPSTRRRMRLNGRAYMPASEDGLIVRAEQVYANCPKYIQKRDVDAIVERGETVAIVQQGIELTTAQQDWVRRADTFFIASLHPESGADASHRGGNPGFIRLSDDASTLYWTDYAGNAMFNTLGNIATHPAAGLLFVDFEGQGDILQITGSAKILWGAEAEAVGLVGAERAVAFQVEAVRQTAGALPLHYRFQEYSKFNPAVR